MEVQRALIAEDEQKAGLNLKRVLQSQGWQVDTAPNGRIALDHLLSNNYKVVLTDLNMPEMNGMELLSHIRGQLSYQPLVLMFSAFFKDDIKQRALDMGVYQCLTKPVDFKELSQAFHCGLHEMLHKKNGSDNTPEVFQIGDPETCESDRPDFAVTGIAVSTGGPQTLKVLFQQLPVDFPLPILIVIHSPGWAIETMIRSFRNKFPFKFQLAEAGQTPEPGNIYIAPADYHMELLPVTGTLIFHQDPLENFVRPSADPLFRSMAKTFGPQAIGVILSGLGKDGAQGALALDQAGASVIVQSPDTATAPFMPRAAVDANPDFPCVPLIKLGRTLSTRAFEISRKLEQKNQTTRVSPLSFPEVNDDSQATD